MRQVTATEKLRAVNEGKMAKKEFVRQMRQQFPMYITQFNGFEDSVQILKNKGMIFETKVEAQIEEKVYDDRPALNYSLDALDRGVRIELEVLGVKPGAAAVKKEDLVAATKKAKDNLEKNPTHYLDLISGESQKVDKNDKMKETERGAKDKDTFNDLKKAALHEGFTEEQIEAAIERIREKKKDKIQRPGFHPDGTPKSNDEMGDDEREDYYNDTNWIDEAKGDDLSAQDLADLAQFFYKYAIQTEMDDYTDVGRHLEEASKVLAQIEAPDHGPGMEEEKASKDYDKDGKIEDEEEEYKGVKDRAIKSAMGKQNELKEAVKSIIKKVLAEEVIEEAATAKLSEWGQTYEDFEGVKSVVNDLENIVTEVEQFYDKIGSKIAKAMERTADFKNDEGLKVGAFIAPGLEAAFRKDLAPVLKKGFFDKVELPKVKMISQSDIDAHNSGERPLGETGIEEPKQTMFTPVMENKKK